MGGSLHMGMFDRDKEFGRNLTDAFPPNVEFIVHAARVEDEPVPTELGMAEKAVLTVSRLSEPGEQFEVTTLASAIVEKTREASADDFPAVCCWMTVQSKKWGTQAVVLQ